MKECICGARELFKRQISASDMNSASYDLLSLRSGCTSAIAWGILDQLIQTHGGWRSEKSMITFTRETQKTLLIVSQSLGLWTRFRNLVKPLCLGTWLATTRDLSTFLFLTYRNSYPPTLSFMNCMGLGIDYSHMVHSCFRVWERSRKRAMKDVEKRHMEDVAERNWTGNLEKRLKREGQKYSGETN